LLQSDFLDTVAQRKVAVSTAKNRLQSVILNVDADKRRRMLDRATVVEFDRMISNGRTRPAIVVCKTTEGDEIDVVAKFSASCDQGVTNLARETIAACLAADLGLPVPKPFLLDIHQNWAASVADPIARTTIQHSAPVAFGSTLVGPQFSAWTDGNILRPAMRTTALGIFVFDAIIQNPDRRSSNPNCLLKGDAIRIFDHELAFTHGVILGWTPPWQLGGLQHLIQPGFHIFRDKLHAENPDFSPIRDSWKRIVDSRLAQYAATIPAEWLEAKPSVESALALIRDARDRIEACLIEVRRILT
jgi:hypothetical protein